MRRGLLLVGIALAALRAPAAAQGAGPVPVTLGVAAVALAGQLAAITPTTLFNTGNTINLLEPHRSVVPGAGLYRANISLILTAAGTAGTISATLTCNNGVIATTQTTATITTTTTLGTEVDLAPVCFAGPATNLQYSTTFTGVTGTPAYTLRIRLEWLP